MSFQGDLGMLATNLTIRIDSSLKDEAESLFKDLGMSLSTAFNIFLRQAVRMQAIPFSISRGITNRVTLAATREAERIAEDPEVPGYRDRASLQKSLES